MFVEGKPRTVFFPPDTLFITFVATVQTRLEHMILGQLRMGERQMTSVPLSRGRKSLQLLSNLLILRKQVAQIGGRYIKEVLRAVPRDPDPFLGLDPFQ